MMVEEQKRRCTKCKQVKRLGLFSKDPKQSLGRGSWCKDCKNHSASPAYSRAWARKKRGFLFSQEQEAALLKIQNYRCAICGIRFSTKKWAFAVDHDHKTGLVRGILCIKCNRGLGFFDDSPLLLTSALSYLQTIPPV